MSAARGSGSPVVLIRGGDDVIVRERVSATVDRLVGDGDHAMMVDDLTLPDRPDESTGDVVAIADVVGSAVSSAMTPPFLTDRRVVVVRGCALLSTKDDVAPLVQYLADPLSTTSLVLVWDLPPGSRVLRRSSPPKSLTDAIKACGGVEDNVDPGKKLGEWVSQRLKDEPYTFDASAVALLVERVGEDPDVLVGYLVNIRGAFAAGTRLSAEDVEPLLVEEGGIPPWLVTDAIEAGDPAAAVMAVQRTMGAGGRHPLQILASLTNYVSNLLALDGSGVGTRDQAAKVLGGNPYVAQKALAQSQRLGSERVADLVRLVAEADLDLRGRRRLPEQLVAEILVARMASRSAAAGRRGGRSARPAGRRR